MDDNDREISAQLETVSVRDAAGEHHDGFDLDPDRQWHENDHADVAEQRRCDANHAEGELNSPDAVIAEIEATQSVPSEEQLEKASDHPMSAGILAVLLGLARPADAQPLRGTLLYCRRSQRFKRPPPPTVEVAASPTTRRIRISSGRDRRVHSSCREFEKMDTFSLKSL